MSLRNSILLVLFLGSCLSKLEALNNTIQSDTTKSKINFSSDFRFRIEHDWNSRNQNGISRDDRSRLRYRFRFGLTYQLNDLYAFGGRLRSGNINDQQGPHVTIGGGNGEFGLTQIGLEKLYFKFTKKWIFGWIGKNDILLEKQNELFWNDNVFPEGVAIGIKSELSQYRFINSFQINGGHYIIKSNGKSFGQDSYLQLIQLVSKHWNEKITIFPTLYYFKDLGYIPDGQDNFKLSYTIFHLGTKVKCFDSPRLVVGVDLYDNLQNYSSQDSIPLNLKNQKKGFVISAKLGQLKNKGDWAFHFYYAHIQKFAIVDYFAQNDWVRWDYSSFNASGARISNFKGVELRAAYNIEKNFNLVLRAYVVQQLITQGSFKEDGNRIRLDLNIKF